MLETQPQGDDVIVSCVLAGPDGIANTAAAGDDIQNIPVGQGMPNRVAITGGEDGIDPGTTVGGDDVSDGTTVTTGPDGICQSTAGGNDVQVIAAGQGEANMVAVLPGPNGIINSAAAGDDVGTGSCIVDGGNGTCESNANNQGAATGLGLTGLFFNNNTGVIIECDVVFNFSAPWVVNPLWNQDPPPEPTLVNLQGTATHEIGHFIGIAHPVMADPAVPDGADGITPTMYGFVFPPFDGNNFNQTLENSDEDACRFLYSPDLGDAPDPIRMVIGQYPTMVHNPGAGRMLNGVQLDGLLDGAEHLFGIKPRQWGRNWTYEWLGDSLGTDNVNGECYPNMPDFDWFDDGITFIPNPPIFNGPVAVIASVRYANDATGAGHTYAGGGGTPLWVNVWADLNLNGIWEEIGGEHFIHASVTPANPVGANATGRTTVRGSVVLPGNPDNPDDNPVIWVRARLDWGEDAGAVANIDRTLNNPKGAAQFGEVEDYWLWSDKVYKQVKSMQPAPGVKLGGAIVLRGDARHLETFGAEVDVDDCVISELPPEQHIATYDAIANETTIEFIDPSQVLQGEGQHTGIVTGSGEGTNYIVTHTRSYWIPESGPPTLDDYIPTTNSAVLFSPSGSTVRVLVGAVNDSTGGVISGGETLGVWYDSVQVEVSYRVSPDLVPLDHLSPCDSLVESLPSIPVGMGTITPESPFSFDLEMPADIDSSEYLIVEIRSAWSVNAQEGHEIVEFLPLEESSGVPDPKLPADRKLRIESYPNPFHPGTKIRYYLPEASIASLEIFDVRGRLVRSLVASTVQPDGWHTVEWNGLNESGERVSPGIHFSRISTRLQSTTCKIVVLE
jgi:hypothetical protein